MQRQKKRLIQAVILHPNETNPEKPMRITIHKLETEERKEVGRFSTSLRLPVAVIDPITRRPFVNPVTGETQVASEMPADGPEKVRRKSLATFIDNIENLFDENGVEIPFPASLDELHKAYLDTETEEDVTVPGNNASEPDRTEPRKIKRSLSEFLVMKVNDDKTFDPDPQESSSASASTGS